VEQEKFDDFDSAFIQAVMMIFATEIGDKTFFIAAIMAMKHGRTLVLSGALAALWVMTVMSVAIGYALPQLIPRNFAHYAAAALFFYFGVKLIYESSKISHSGSSEELEEVEKELGYRGKENETQHDDEAGGVVATKEEDGSEKLFSHSEEDSSGGLMSSAGSFRVARDAFVLTFLAEWGDRSQIATIAMGTSHNVFGVVVGGCLGHAICTGVAVQGGVILASRISEKTVTLVGGVLFLLFGIHEVIWG